MPAIAACTLELLHRSLREGDLPLWNPHALAGAPFVATHQPGALYPPMLLLAPLPPALALSIDTILHLAIAGVGAVLLARRLGLGGAASLVCAAISRKGVSSMAPDRTTRIRPGFSTTKSRSVSPGADVT